MRPFRCRSLYTRRVEERPLGQLESLKSLIDKIAEDQPAGFAAVFFAKTLALSEILAHTSTYDHLRQLFLTREVPNWTVGVIRMPVQARGAVVKTYVSSSP